MRFTDLKLSYSKQKGVTIDIIKNNKVKEQIDVTREFIDIATKVLDGKELVDKDGNIFLSVMRQLDKEQVVVLNEIKEKNKEIQKKKYSSFMNVFYNNCFEFTLLPRMYETIHKEKKNKYRNKDNKNDYK